MVAIGDHLRITTTMTQVGVEGDFLNVFYYKVTGATGSPVLQESGVGLETWWREEMASQLTQVQASIVVHERMLVESMENWATEFIDLPFSPAITGVVVQDPMPTAMAWSFAYNRELRTTRSGRKSFVGIPEALVNGNTPTAGTMTLLNNVAVAFGSGWTIDNGDGSLWQMSPVIAKTPTPPATRPTVYNDITGVSFRGVGTQNTRKRL